MNNISHYTDNIFNSSHFPIGGAYNIKTDEDINKIVGKGLKTKNALFF